MVDDFRNASQMDFYLENVQTEDGTYWRYCGRIQDENVYRIQYYRDDDE